VASWTTMHGRKVLVVLPLPLSLTPLDGGLLIPQTHAPPASPGTMAATAPVVEAKEVDGSPPLELEKVAVVDAEVGVVVRKPLLLHHMKLVVNALPARRRLWRRRSTARPS
jgi:hypothetical protein